MKPAKLPLEPITEGNAFDGIPSITVTGDFTEAALASVTMRFRPNDEKPGESVELSSAVPGQITIESSSPGAWTISVPRQLIPGLSRDTYIWQITFTDANGFPLTLLEDTLEIRKKI